MRRIELPGTNLVLPRLLFGTARLFNAGSAATRARLLDVAFDHGFTHFDTAPLYGFGQGERDVGRLLARHRDTTVSAKVGIYPPGGTAQPPAAIFLRKAAGHLVPPLSRAIVDFSVQRAMRSLDGTLRRLGRERIEIYQLHEPPYELVRTDEWLGWLEREQYAGRVGRYGISTDLDHIHPFLQGDTPLAQVISMKDSVDRREADVLGEHGRKLQITYGYVTSALARGGTVDTAEIMRGALARNKAGAIVVGSNRPERIAELARIAAEEAA